MATSFNVLRAIPFACIVLTSTAVHAQQVINGTTETVPGSKPNPWSTGALTVGSTGTGTLNIGAGGTVNSTTGVLGSTATGNGTINVTGTAARWNTTGNVTIGNTGQGTLDIGTGGSVSSTGSGTAFIGNSAGGVGTVTVSGAGATWTNSSIQIGGLWTSPLVPGGIGTMTISNGGRVTSNQSWIGSTTGSVGSVTVTGAGSSWAVNGNLPIGPYGTGTLIIESGATMTNGQAQLGTSTSTGTAIVRGAGTTWTSTSGTILNKGIVSVEDGAKSISTGQVTSDGTMTVTGVNSSLTSTSLVSVGSINSGTLNVENSATVSGLRGRIGIGAAGSATVAGGSRWDTTEFFRIGESTNGTLTISGGSTVTTGVRASDGEAASIGTNTTGQGTVTVTGANSKFLNSSTLTLGKAGMANVTVEQTAAMTSAGGSLGSTATGRGTVALTSGGSWTSSGALTIGDASSGNSITVTGTGTGGVASSLALTAALTLGNTAGSNSLSVLAGGRASATGAFTAGTAAGSAGNQLLVSGAGAKLSAGGFNLGLAGANNTAVIMDGGALETSGPSLIGGPAASANGNLVDVVGPASTWSLGSNLSIGSAASSGNTLRIRNGAAVTQAGGSTAIASGNLLDVGAGSTFTTDGAIAVQTNARLSVAADSRVNGGSLSMASGSQLDVFAQEGNSSLVTLSGKADLGGTLNATIDGRSSLSYRFLVLHAGEVEGTFDNAVLSDYSANLDWTVFYTPNDVFLQLEAQIGDIPGLNENQTNVGTALDDFFNKGGELPPGFVPILGLTGDALGNALSQLSGEVGASGGAAAVVSANTSFMRSMLDHATPDCAEQKLNDPEKRCEHAVWATAFGSTAGLPGNGENGSHDTTTTVGGIATGWDHVKDNTHLGIALAGGGTGWNLDGNGLGSGDSTFLQLGAYGTQQIGNAYASLAGAYALQGMSTTRKVNVLSPETLAADFIANAVAGRGEAGYRFGAGDGFGLTPYAAVQGQAIRLPGYDETGTLDSGSYALSYNAATTTAVRSELGMGMDVTSEAALFSGHVAWAHDWLNDAQARARFQSLPGTSFIVNGAEAPSDLALVSLAADVGITEQAAVTARFDGEFGADYQSYAGTLALTYAW